MVQKANTADQYDAAVPAGFMWTQTVTLSGKSMRQVCHDVPLHSRNFVSTPNINLVGLTV